MADVTLSQLTFASGVRAHIFVSWLHPFKEQRLVVVGSEKMAVFDDTAADKLVLYPHRVEWKDRVPNAVKADGRERWHWNTRAAATTSASIFWNAWTSRRDAADRRARRTARAEACWARARRRSRPIA